MKSSDKDSPQEAWKYALRLLNARDYTSARLLEKLLAKGYEQESSRYAIERLQQEGWLNDSRFAIRFAESAMASGRYFGVRLKLEMRRRGLPTELVDNAIEEATGDLVEFDVISTVLKSRYPDFSYTTSDDREKRRVVGYLQRKGFGLSAILNTLKRRE